MSYQLVICLIAVAVNLVGMLVIYSAMSGGLSRLARHGQGIFAVIALIVVAQLFWIAPALWIAGREGRGHATSYALWFGNWLVTGFSLVVLWKSAARIPIALGDAAQVDGLGGFGSWRYTVLPFVRRDLLLLAVFLLMALLMASWYLCHFPDDMTALVVVLQRTETLRQHLVLITAASLFGAIPLIGIFFASRKS